MASVDRGGERRETKKNRHLRELTYYDVRKISKCWKEIETQ